MENNIRKIFLLAFALFGVQLVVKAQIKYEFEIKSTSIGMNLDSLYKNKVKNVVDSLSNILNKIGETDNLPGFIEEDLDRKYFYPVEDLHHIVSIRKSVIDGVCNKRVLLRIITSSDKKYDTSYLHDNGSTILHRNWSIRMMAQERYKILEGTD